MYIKMKSRFKVSRGKMHNLNSNILTQLSSYLILISNILEKIKYIVHSRR